MCFADCSADVPEIDASDASDDVDDVVSDAASDASDDASEPVDTFEASDAPSPDDTSIDP